MDGRSDGTVRQNRIGDSGDSAIRILAPGDAVVVRAATVFAEETKPVPTGIDSRMEMRIVLRVFVLIRLTRFC